MLWRAALDVVEIVSTISDDMTILNTIIQEGSQVGMDLQSLQVQITSLFDLSTAPATSSELMVRVDQIHQAVWQIKAYAMRVNTLVQTFQNTLTHLNLLIDSIAELAGTKQNLQVLNQKTALLVQVQTTHATMQASYQQAQLYDQMEQMLVTQSWRNIHDAMMSDMPTTFPSLH